MTTESNTSTTFYKFRSLQGRISEGFKFVSKNFLQFFRVSIPVVLPLAALVALGNLGLQSASSTTIWGSMALLPVVEIVLTVVFFSLLFAMLQERAEKGTVPVRTMKGWWPSVRKNLVRSLHVALVFLFVGLIVFAICMMPVFTCDDWLWQLFWFFALLGLCFLLFLPLALLPPTYLLSDRSLMSSLTTSFGRGYRHYGSTFVLLLLTGLVYLMVSSFGSLPAMVMTYVEQLVRQSLAEGTDASLPGYFQLLYFLVTLLSVLISWYASLLLYAPIAHQYASLEAAKREKEE